MTRDFVKLYQGRQKRRQRAREWYETSLGMLGRLQQAAHRATVYQDEPDYGSLRERLEPLTEEMIEHANSAPSKVSEQARIDMATLSAFATGLVIISEQCEGMSWEHCEQTVEATVSAVSGITTTTADETAQQVEIFGRPPNRMQSAQVG